MSHWDDFSDDTSDEALDNMAEQTPIAPASDQCGIHVTIDHRALDTILEAAAHRIARTLEDRVAKMVEKRITEVVDEAWRATIGDMAKQAIEDYLTKPRRKTNNYGEPIGQGATISEIIPQSVAEYMEMTVDSEGRHTSSSRVKRLDWIVQHLVLKQIQEATAKAAGDVTAKARQVVANHVARFVSEQMVPAIELSKG